MFLARRLGFGTFEQQKGKDEDIDHRGGNMGQTFARSFISTHIVRPEQNDHPWEIAWKAMELDGQKLGLLFGSRALLSGMRIILAVKPQDFEGWQIASATTFDPQNK